MAAFEYSALNQQGKTTSGVLEADSTRQVSQKLKEQALIPLQITEIQRHKSSDKPMRRLFQRRVSNVQLAILTRQLATMLRSGSPVESALSAVLQQTQKAHVKTILTAIRARVREGYTLAAAMDEFPAIFPKLYRATIAAGEQSGKLDFVLGRLADHVEQSQALRSKITLALVYPVVLTLVALLVTIVLLTYVVPKVVQVFENIDQALPGITLFLIAISDFLQHYGLYLGLAVLLAVIIFNMLNKNAAFRYGWHRFLLKVPGIAHLIKGINTAVFARTFSILMSSGVNALEAMKIASTVMNNEVMKQSVQTAAERVREGSAINHALEQTGCFPPMTVYLIASGESSGNLVEMLEHAAESQEKEFSTITSVILGLFEPLLIVTMGGVVLFIVIAILLPIFKLNQLVGV